MKAPDESLEFITNVTVLFVLLTSPSARKSVTPGLARLPANI